MPVLKNARWERFAQNIAKGMAIGKAYTAAGYKAKGHTATVNGARLLRNADIKARIEFLQGADADQIIEVRDAAREHTREAIETLVSVMNSTEAPAAARVAASQGILDRGYGKATQHIEADINVLDGLSHDGKRGLLAAIEALDAGEDGDQG